MRSRPCVWVTCAILYLVAAVMTTPDASAQTPKASKRLTDTMAITGLASSAKHCVSGTSSNVHSLGWIQTGSRVTVTVQSDFDPIAGIVVLAIDTAAGQGGYVIDDDSGGNLEPAIQYTASFSGNAALYISGYRSTSGCYWYKLEVIPPASSVSGEARPQMPDKQSVVRPAAITGSPSVAYHCSAGSGAANIYSIGRITQGSRVVISFDTDFDAVAGLVNLDLFAANPTPRYWVDDDSGGRLAPALSITAGESGTLALFVGGYGGVAGCYRFRVEIQ